MFWARLPSLYKLLLRRLSNAANHRFSRQQNDGKNECKLVTQKDLKGCKNECKLVTEKEPTTSATPFYSKHSPWASDKIHIGFPISRHLGHLQGFRGVLHELVDLLAALRLGHHASAKAKHGNIWQHQARHSQTLHQLFPLTKDKTMRKR